MVKFSDNPPMSYPNYSEDPLTPAPLGRWWVAHTRPRNEKALAHVLREWELRYFLPMVERIHIRRRRKVKSLLPLFPGYLFFAADEMERYRVMTTNRVVRVIHVEDQDQLSDELTQIRGALSARAKLDPYPFVKEGVRCRVTSGAFQGVEGMVERRKGRTKLVLQVEVLGQAVAFETDAGMVEPVN